MAVRMSADEFLKSENHGYELYCGEPVEMSMGALSSWTNSRTGLYVGSWMNANPLGHVFDAEAGYSLWPERPNEVRKPDVSVVLRGRLPGERLPHGWIPIPPDLAIEVVSKNDEGPKIEQKINEYLSTGVRLLWVIYPESRTAYVYRADGTVTRIDENGVLSGEDALPGFEMRLSLVLPPPDAVGTD